MGEDKKGGDSKVTDSKVRDIDTIWCKMYWRVCVYRMYGSNKWVKEKDGEKIIQRKNLFRDIHFALKWSG